MHFLLKSKTSQKIIHLKLSYGVTTIVHLRRFYYVRFFSGGISFSCEKLIILSVMVSSIQFSTTVYPTPNRRMYIQMFWRKIILKKHLKSHVLKLLCFHVTWVKLQFKYRKRYQEQAIFLLVFQRLWRQLHAKPRHKSLWDTKWELVAWLRRATASA